MAHIWHADVRIAWPAAPQRDADDESCDPAAELVRFGKLKTLRSLLQRLVTQHGGGALAPPLAFERWLARAALHGAAPDVLPAGHTVDPQLVADLARTLPREATVLIAEALTRRSRADAERLSGGETPVDPADTRRLVKAVKKAGKPVTAEGWTALSRAAEALATHAQGRAEALMKPATYKVQVDTEGKNVRLCALDADGPRKPYMLISHAHYDKLKTLHDRFGSGDADERIFCVVTRYEALRGAGFQCAVPGACFEALRTYLGNTVECFASPLNCRFERYFSAFPSLERRFGSLGSFFEAWETIEEGSFECNPPFVPEVMAFAQKKMETLLAKAGALSFLVVVPDWGGSQSTAEKCRASPFLCAHVTIPASDHVFVDGAQHRVKDRHRPSSWDTAVLLLQNDAGRAKWPLDTPTLSRVVGASFARAANEAVQGGAEDLGAWERRGPGRGGKKRPRAAPGGGRGRGRG